MGLSFHPSLCIIRPLNPMSLKRPVLQIWKVFFRFFPWIKIGGYSIEYIFFNIFLLTSRRGALRVRCDACLILHWGVFCLSFFHKTTHSCQYFHSQTASLSHKNNQNKINFHAKTIKEWITQTHNSNKKPITSLPNPCYPSLQQTPSTSHHHLPIPVTFGTTSSGNQPCVFIFLHHHHHDRTAINTTASPPLLILLNQHHDHPKLTTTTKPPHLNLITDTTTPPPLTVVVIPQPECNIPI